MAEDAEIIRQEIIRWPIDRATRRGLAQDVWTITREDGAIEARRQKGLLTGQHQLERFSPAKDSQGRLWPGEFKFNPWTREILEPALSQLDPTSGRWGSACGLPILDAVCTSIDPRHPQSEDLEQGAFYLGHGGRPGFLFAVDPKAGVVFRKSRLEERWIDHGSYPRSPLEPWSNGLAGTLDAIYYSADQHLIRLNEDPEDDGAERYALGRMLASPASLQTSIAAPFRDSDGLSVGWLQIGGVLKRLPARDGASARGEEALSAPVVGVGGVVFWIGASGFLSFEIARTATSAVWRPWPEGFAAIPFLRPYRSANGALWAFGQDSAGNVGGRAAVCELSATDGSRSVRLLEGPHVSAGEATYRGLQKYARPWADPVDAIQPGLDMGDRWALPIVSLPGGDTVIALVAGMEGMRSFLFREGHLFPRPATLFLHRPSAGLVAMGHSLDLTTTDEIDTFVSSGRLHIYHRDTNECVSWPLV